MNPALLRKEVQEYLSHHITTPLDKFIFKGSPFEDITIQELAQQLDGRNRIKQKLPLWNQTRGILFPPKINLEQTSSESTAQYKASLISGDSLIDLTGGFGIDSYYFSQKARQVTYIEQDEIVCAFAKANFSTLNASNIKAVHADSINYLKQQNIFFDTIYIDPSRRNDQKGKVFMLKDCLPNVIDAMDLLLKKGKEIWIKTAPILDIDAGIKELKNVAEIHIVAVKNEVKELLWKITSIPNTYPAIIVSDLELYGKDQKLLIDTRQRNDGSLYSTPKKYLYEPSSALMKSGCFNWISTHYNLFKLHPNSHLYTSSECINFQGRIFKIDRVLPYKDLNKKNLVFKKANISTRNFPLSVQEIRKKHKIKDGGETYLFFTSQEDRSLIVIECSKIL